MSRYIEGLSGPAALLAGAAGIAYALFGPTISRATAGTGPNGRIVIESDTISWWEDGVEPVALYFLSAVVLMLTIVAAAAALHALCRVRRARLALWPAAVLLLLAAAATGLSIGPFLLPAALLALVAAFASLFAEAGTRAQGPRSP